MGAPKMHQQILAYPESFKTKFRISSDSAGRGRNLIEDLMIDIIDGKTVGRVLFDEHDISMISKEDRELMLETKDKRRKGVYTNSKN